MECTKQSGSMAAVMPAGLEETDKKFCPVSFHRKNVRCFRIERLFSFEGHKFVFGFYYARPHEVYCEPGKLFHEKEVNFYFYIFGYIILHIVIVLLNI